MRIYTGEYKARGPRNALPSVGHNVGPWALYSPEKIRKPVSKKIIQTKLNNTSFCSFPKTAQANDSQASILFAPGPHDDTVTSQQSSCNNYLFTSTQQASYHATINNSFISNFQTPTTQCRPSSCYRFPINDTRQWSDRTLPSAPPVNPGSQLLPSQFSMSTTSTTALPGSVPQTTPQEEFPSLLNKDIEWSSSMSHIAMNLSVSRLEYTSAMDAGKYLQRNTILLHMI